jgi:hypothetical protein
MDELLCAPPSNGRRGGVFQMGNRLPITLAIAQQGTGPELTAVVTLGEATGALTGIHRGSGFFQLQGTLSAPGVEVRVTHWDARVRGDAMEGLLAFQVRFGGLPGAGGAAVHLDGVVRR